MTETRDEVKEAEPVVYRTTIHWAALLGPGMLFIMGGVSVRARPLAALIMIGLALVWGLLSIHNLRASEFAIGTSRLTIRIGFPFKRFYEFPFSQIAGADYHQPALGVILNFGKVMIMHTTGKTIVFRLVAKPNDFVERLRREVDRFRQEQEPGPTGG
ncbi:MAG: PH domain-containing protein [Syntrophorhabdaceae bacterium]|nr:PH domain-containing protein [Syntrophorhabdaceae bacterium]